MFSWSFIKINERPAIRNKIFQSSPESKSLATVKLNGSLPLIFFIEYYALYAYIYLRLGN
jgi:hypothetical protein